MHVVALLESAPPDVANRSGDGTCLDSIHLYFTYIRVILTSSEPAAIQQKHLYCFVC